VYSRDEIIADIRALEQRLSKLEPRVLAAPDKPLTSGTWTVRDAVCHMAADSNAIPGFLARVERQRTGAVGRPAGFNLDAHNEEGIALRKPKPLTDVFAEIHAGMKSDMAGVEALPEDLLSSDIPNFRGVVTPASDQVRFTTVGHTAIHLDDIEAALDA
jgi:hypothetical protein